MEIKINLDLQEMISNACSAEKLQPIISKAITETVKDAIESATGYRSAFRETLKTQFAEAMPHGLNVSDVVKFQQLMNSAMNDLVLAANNNTIKTAMDAAVEKAFPNLPARIKLSELMKEARSGLHVEEGERFFACYDEGNYGCGHLFLDASDSCRSKHDASIRLSFSKDSGSVYRLKLEGENITPSSRPTVIDRFDSLLMALYVGRSTLEVDIDSDEVESLSDAQDDN